MITTAFVIVFRVSLLTAMAAVLARLLRGSSAATRHLIWAIAIGASLIIPIVYAIAPPVRVAILPASQIRGSSAGLRPQEEVSDAGRPDRRIAPFRGSAHSPADAAVPSTASRFSSPGPAAFALGVWLAGVCVVLLRFAIGTARMRFIARQARRVDDGRWLRLAQSLAWTLGVTREVTFLEGATHAMPMTWGVLHPCVLLPESAAAWPVARQRVVLLHELAHVKRRDCLTQMLAQLLCAVYWFNPLAWFAAHQLQAERERACDDVVLAAGTKGSDYADHLLQIARAMRSSLFPTWAAVAMAHRSQLEGRLIAILDPAVPRRFPTRRQATALVATLGVVLVPLAIVTPVPRAAQIVAAESVADWPASPASAAAPVKQPAAIRSPAVKAQTAPIASAIREAVKDAVPDATRDLAREGWLSPIVAATLPALGEVVGQAIGTAVATGTSGGVKAGVHGGAEGGIGARAQSDAETTKHHDPRAVAALIEALKDPDAEVRESAMQALASMRAPEAIDAMRAALKDANPSVREQAVFALGQYKDKASIDSLAAALADSAADVREQAAFALGQIRDPKSTAPLARALNDSDADVREQAAFALGQLRAPEAVEPLTAALRDRSSDVREQSAFALGQLRDPRAVDPLVGALKDENADVREQAAFALGQLRDSRAIEALTAALKDSNVEVRRQAAFALGQISK